MHFDDLSAEATRVIFWGSHAALEIRSPLPGVLRLRHLPSLGAAAVTLREVPSKQSWSVLEHPERPLSIRKEGQGSAQIVVVGAEELALEVQLAQGTWQLRDASGRELGRCDSFAGEVRPDYPVTRYRSRLALRAPAGRGVPGLRREGGAAGQARHALHVLEHGRDAAPPGHGSALHLHSLLPGPARGRGLGLLPGRDVALRGGRGGRRSRIGCGGSPGARSWTCTSSRGRMPADVVQRYVR